MACLRLNIGEESLQRLIAAAAAEYRPTAWHAEYLLLKALDESEGRQAAGNIIPLHRAGVPRAPMLGALSHDQQPAEMAGE